MDRKHNKTLVSVSKMLRKNMTSQERKLWYEFLRKHLARFSRQKILGRYIADFYSAQAQMIVELDGGHHFLSDETEKDNQRTNYLAEYGLKVVRIPNNEIDNNFEGVCEYLSNEIALALKKERQSLSHCRDSSLYTREPFYYVI